MVQTKWTSFFLWCLLATTTVFGQPSNTEFADRMDEIFHSWDSNGKPGGAVGVFEGGELIFKKAYGMASLEYEVPNEINTVFNIASVSKQITAFSMLLLEQQGKLSLDDDIRKYLFEIPDFGHTITIRHLLQHTSGLRNFQNILAMAGWREGESMTNEDLLRFLAKQRELNFKPGEEYLYCNTGFNIVTAIVERITNQSFQDWTRDNIFLPLGMEDSGYREDLEVIHKNTATCYQGSEAEGFRQPLKYWTYMGNGNVYTTVEDFSKWMNNLRNPTLGGKELIDKMVTKIVLNNGKEWNYGLGIGVGTYRGLKVYRHGGSVGGYRSNMMYFPEEEIGIIVFGNFSGANPGGKAAQVADLVLADAFSEEQKQSNGPTPFVRNKAPFNLEQFKSYTGKYYLDGVIVDVTEKEGIGFVYAQGQLPAPLALVASSDTSYYVENVGINLWFYPPNDKEELWMQVEFQGERYWGVKMEESEMSTELLGTYYSPELDTRYTIVEEKGGLAVRHARHDSFQLIHKSKNNLLGTAYFFADVKVERDDDNQVKGLRVSNGRVRNLWFEKL